MKFTLMTNAGNALIRNGVCISVCVYSIIRVHIYVVPFTPIIYTQFIHFCSVLEIRN